MDRLDENYYLRKYYFKEEKVPTQSVMMAKMSPPLARLYFKSMTPKLKVLAGLEPPMKGGGSDWFVPPKDLLDGKAVLKPVKKEYLKNLGCEGIGIIGEDIVKAHRKEMEQERRKALLENDEKWKTDIEAACRKHWEEKSKEAALQNTTKIKQAFHEFSTLFRTSLTKIEELLLDASIKEIERIKNESYNKMSRHYERLLKQQATTLYDTYTAHLDKEYKLHKSKFLENLDNAQKNVSDRLHDINVEKHIAVEKLRCLLESQNLACQIYVAIKEKEECEKELKLSKHEHSKQIKILDDQIRMKNFEIQLAQEKEKKQLEFNKIWLKKICHVIKKFQDFVRYCLKTLPDHADFFINIEKLMLLQLSDAMENPEVESMFVPDEENFHTPVARPHPFYLFCDKGYKAQVDQNLCPKHCTSSATQLPVIIVNKKCIYASCDNLDEFTDKVKDFIEGKRGDDADFSDDHDYTYDIPVKCSSSQQVSEIKMESSMMQVLQKDFPNIKEVPIKCCLRKVPFCFCSPVQPSKTSIQAQKEQPRLMVNFERPVSPGVKMTRDIELEHEREPKWDSFLKYVKPTRCKCAKTVKKHLEEHLPPYMINMSAFEDPAIPYYEPCSIKTLKNMVSKARGIRPAPLPDNVEPRTRDISTQYSDQEFDFLCTCFSEDEVDRLLKELLKGPDLFATENKFEVVEGAFSASFLEKDPASFAMETAKCLKQLLVDSSELKEVFQKDDCKF